MIILDTNVLSEPLRPVPDPRVRAWVNAQVTTSLFVTTVSQAEMLFGVALLPHGRRRRSLQTAIELIFEVEFAERTLPFDSSAARAYPMVAAQRRSAGRPVTAEDAFIAAIAKSRDAALATRNVFDFSGCGIDLIDPWHT